MSIASLQQAVIGLYLVIWQPSAVHTTRAGADTEMHTDQVKTAIEHNHGLHIHIQVVVMLLSDYLVEKMSPPKSVWKPLWDTQSTHAVCHLHTGSDYLEYPYQGAPVKKMASDFAPGVMAKAHYQQLLSLWLLQKTHTVVGTEKSA